MRTTASATGSGHCIVCSRSCKSCFSRIGVLFFREKGIGCGASRRSLG